MPDSRVAHVPWWPFILAMLLGIAVVVVGVLLYMANAKNAVTSHEKDQLSSSILTLSEENKRLSLRVGELECVGKWDGETCTKAPATLTASPSTGTTPLAAVFTVRASSGDYRVDFGDNASSTVSTTSACTKEKDGLCTFTLKHSYRLAAGATTTSYSAKLLKDANVEATADIVVNKK